MDPLYKSSTPDMSEEREMPEQRAFSPEEVATMLGVERGTVSSLLRKGELGSKEIGDLQRIFLSDLEDYLGEERARSLVCEINSGEKETGCDTPRVDRSESAEISGNEFRMGVYDESEAERELEARGDRRRTSRYEPVAQKWSEIDKDEEAILLSGLSENDVQNIRNLLYLRFGKENVVVRTARQGDGTFKAVVRDREGNKYLRE
jgi:excisionase family DNA binding protein